MKSNRSIAVSTAAFAIVTIVLIIVAASGFYLYGTTSATTVTSTTTKTAISTATSTTVSTQVVPGVKSGGFVTTNLGPSTTPRTTRAPPLSPRW